MGEIKFEIIKYVRNHSNCRNHDIIEATGCLTVDIEDLVNAGYLIVDQFNHCLVVSSAGYGLFLLTEQQYEFQRTSMRQFVITNVIAALALCVSFLALLCK